MKKISIYDIYTQYNLINKNVVLFGWVRNRRHSKCGISFIDIYDGSCLRTIQGVITNNILNYESEILKLTNGCSIRIEGMVIWSMNGNQKYEIKINKIQVIGWVDCPGNYPIASKKHTCEYLRSIPHLRSRTNLFSAITRIRNGMFYAIHTFLNNFHYYWIPTPIITGLNSEGAGEMFRVSMLSINNKNNFLQKGINVFKDDFFGKETFLTVSGQLTAEAYACAMTKVYTFGPTFRAENSNTTRHLAEFWMLEIEGAFLNLQDIIQLSTDIIKYIIQYILQYHILDIEFFYNQGDRNIFYRLEQFINTKIIQIEYSDAIDILLTAKINFKHAVSFGADLFLEHEKYLVDKYFCAPVFITNYPKHLKAFYMRMNHDNNTVAAMDFLVPNIGEVIGGSEREERQALLKNRILEAGLDIKNYDWYLDLRRYGSVPHAGFGLGFERLLSYITGVRNVRDLIPFPRTVNHALC
ncbi:asparagine--tRNA ligase [Buchnera aphidicola]|uniref:Asparagine--tRNA ligase n=1 Tax=Buchnera aphidicola (Sarucallis kahawaluokalani) TaxID=1241878 RepID=A0A4D6YM12_9GAMM|nr:asparagine--tRNA ligase [Buchnera aphidicola]QCI26035.1 asparagine--tRNA ligase [Buchnera aphidicola (Sarucallis kahawaluokalani)]